MTTLEAERDAMVAAVLADPADYQPRIAYADWLDDHDGDKECAACRGVGKLFSLLGTGPQDCEPCGGSGRVANRFAERAEFIRLQINSPMPSGDAIEVTPALVRLSELWYGAEIGAGRPAADGFEMLYGRPPETPWGDWSFSMMEPFDGAMRPYAWVRGGFVEQLSLPAVLFLGGTCPACDDDTRAAGLAARCWCGGTGDLPSVAPAVFAQQPVRRVTLSDFAPTEVRFGNGTALWHWGALQATGAANVQEILQSVNLRAGTDYTGRSAERAVDLLSDALVDWGRKQARGRSHLRKCPQCRGDGLTWGSPEGPDRCAVPGCYQGSIRFQGLPPLPSREAANV